MCNQLSRIVYFSGDYVGAYNSNDDDDDDDDADGVGAESAA